MSERTSLREKPSTRTVLGLSGLALASVLTVGCANGERLDSVPEKCESPITASDTYPGDPNALPGMQWLWQNGVLVTTVVPSEAEGVVFHFRAPGNPEWHDSQLVDPDLAGEVGLRQGDGPVIFGVSLEAAAGSAACVTAPDATFSKVQPFEPLSDAGLTEPNW